VEGLFGQLEEVRQDSTETEDAEIEPVAEEEDEVLVVRIAHTVVDPRAVMIKLAERKGR